MLLCSWISRCHSPQSVSQCPWNVKNICLRVFFFKNTSSQDLNWRCMYINYIMEVKWILIITDNFDKQTPTTLFQITAAANHLKSLFIEDSVLVVIATVHLTSLSLCYYQKQLRFVSCSTEAERRAPSQCGGVGEGIWYPWFWQQWIPYPQRVLLRL